MVSHDEISDRLRAVAAGADLEIDDERLRALAPQVLALLSRQPPITLHGLAETEPAFGLRLRKE